MKKQLLCLGPFCRDFVALQDSISQHLLNSRRRTAQKPANPVPRTP